MSVRVAVVGVGHLGRHHARILAALPGVHLVAVVDINRERADQIAAAHGTKALFDYHDLLGAPAGLQRADGPGGAAGVDAVTIAVPTELHAEVGSAFLEAGIPTLVEKPLARNLVEADRLMEASAGKETLLAVGHTERFNPAVAAVRPLVTDPRFIEVHRLGTFPERSLDIDVVFDLMIHDLDVVLSLVPSPVESLDAVGVPVLTNRVDIANARLRFANGCIANLTASRISRDRVRKIRFFQSAVYVSIDYAAQKAEVWRLVDGGGGKPSIEGGELEVATEEPLKRELVDFLEAVRSKRPPLVTASEGRRALALAEQITDRMSEAARASRRPKT
jgi:predicted dehydrogenase